MSWAPQDGAIVPLRAPAAPAAVEYIPPGKIRNMAEAFAEALCRWGRRASVGTRRPVDGRSLVFVVRRTGRYAIDEIRGEGSTWDEAFEKAKEWPDGLPPAPLRG